ncbi:FtsX-like permease family protein [Microbacterium sp. cf046]|uniref:FtsX-like permease family protein n=1 Tax=Microbacterium sp. cf046 TaxID=1761803 RepID=UPI000B8515A6|nr:FtsX-like permease family protein [Microbacterium sp. cf046]
MRERRSAAGLMVRQARADAPLIALAAFVIAMASLLVTAAPAALASLATAELRHTLDGFPAVRRDLTASGTFGHPSARRGSTGDALATITDTIERAPAALGPPLTTLLETPQWAALTDRESAQIRGSTPGVVGLELGLAVSPEWRDLIEITDGSPPAAWTGDDDVAQPSSDAIEIALSAAAAQEMGIAVGDVLDFGVAPVRVAALYEPTDADDPFWQHEATLAGAVERRADDGRKLLAADGLVDPGSIAGLAETFAGARIEAWYPLKTAELTAADAPELAQQVRQISATGEVLPTGEFVVFSSILASDLDAIRQRVEVATALMALLVAGPLGVVLAVLALAARTIAQRRAVTLGLARVRGATGTQLRVAMLLEGLLIAIPSAAIGAGVAVALFAGAYGGRSPIEIWPAVVVVLAAFPLLLAASAPRPQFAGRSPAAAYRWVLELIVVGAAAASVVLLARRGVVASGSGLDPLLAAAPLLVAAAGTLGVLRIYPLLMRAVQRSSRRSRSAVSSVGSARAARAPTLGFATAFALIVGISVAVFSLGTASTLRRALSQSVEATRREIPPLDAGHPLVAAVFALLGLAVVVTLVLCLTAVVLGVVATTRQRDGVIGILRVLGFSTAQLRGVVAWELAPVALVATVAAVALGLVEVFVVVAAIDLPAFVGAEPSVPRVDALATTAIVLVTAAAVTVAALVAAAIARRRSPAASLRMGLE